ncbi:hypothetical protein GLYMA_15G258650v4 [Glycine max]|nr:hypothetical protein GYH30_043484 [Glycine max]KRH13916.2 hypothetical protein GLYMA_15G258650v4 [Glycine max]
MNEKRKYDWCASYTCSSAFLGSIDVSQSETIFLKEYDPRQCLLKRNFYGHTRCCAVLPQKQPLSSGLVPRLLFFFFLNLFICICMTKKKQRNLSLVFRGITR